MQQKSIACSENTNQPEAEIDRLRKGIQDYLDGNYENPRQHRNGPGNGKCQHGVWWWEECGQCAEAHFTKLLVKP